MPGQTRIGRYEVVSALGRGAMGTVYKAIDPQTGRAVAVKTINLDLSQEDRAEFIGRFHREATAARLSHANIVAIHEVGETDDIAYIAMDYVEGVSLREMLDSDMLLPIERIASIAARVADALNYAHDNHVVHRDIKPENIMITLDHGVKIKDFGIAQIPAGSSTQPGTILGIPGSPKYMAPEQVAGGNTDGRTDIFALGVVLYEMLTGVTPFNGDNLGAIAYKILKEEPVPPSTLNARVPPAFDRIISRALAKRPRDRYQTALEFARDLRKPEAATRQTARRPAASIGPAKAVQTSGTPAEQQDATAFLPPHDAREEKVDSLRGKAPQGRKPLLRAILILILIMTALVMYSQDHQSRRDELAASLAKPTVSAAPAVAAAPTVAARPTVSAAVAASETPAVSVSPKGLSKPRVSVKQRLLETPPVPESESVSPPVSVTQPNATLTLAISPWGEVVVDGKSVGVSPPLTVLQLEAGTHLVEIRNQGFEPYRNTVNLEPDTSLKIKHKFK